MSTSKIILDDAELAKSYITNSTLSDEYKRLYIRLINLSTLATNGISPDEKIQKMTECIQLLAVTQGMYLVNIDEKIESAIDKANLKQCQNCKAMKHAEKFEQEQHDKEIMKKYIGQYELQNSLTDQQTTLTWQNIFKTILIKPYIYVVLSLMIISPYGVDIVKTLCQYFIK